MHVHFRTGEMAELVIPLTAATFAGAVVMPNVMDANGNPVLVSKEAVIDYKNQILAICEKYNTKLNPYMTLFMRRDGYTYEFLEDIKDEIIGIKLYPQGLTTNSEHGLSNMFEDTLLRTLDYMQHLGIPLMVHGETNGFVMNRETEFTEIYRIWAAKFPNLKIIMEHITTKESANLLDEFENLFATITVHHLMITLDDVAGGMLQPHLFCKPIAKTPDDRRALRRLALTGHDKICLGTDSAPHPQSKKECCGCAAGVFTAPIAIQLLVQEFLDTGEGSEETLQKFVSDNAQRIYNIKPLEKTVKLERRDRIVPAQYFTHKEDDPNHFKVIPMCAGQKLNWSLVM